MANHPKPQMLLALSGSVLLFVGLVAAYWAALWGLVRWILAWISGSVGLAPVVATILLSLSAAFARALVARSAILPADCFDTRPPTDEEFAAVNPLVTRLCQQYDVPAPAIRIVDSPVPHASVTGYRPSGATLVLSTTVVERLEADELQAVLGHELAHVKNRDVALYTILSVPVVVSRRVLDASLAAMTDEHGNENASIVALALGALSGIVWFVSKTLIAALSRYREVAADVAATTATGEPAALAAALKRLEQRSDDVPARDLRTASPVSSLSIVEHPKPSERFAIWGTTGSSEEFTIWADGRTPFTVRFVRGLIDLTSPLFRTHPDVDDRIRRIRSG